MNTKTQKAYLKVYQLDTIARADMAHGHYYSASLQYRKAEELCRKAGLTQEADKYLAKAESCEVDAADVAGSIKYGF